MYETTHLELPLNTRLDLWNFARYSLRRIHETLQGIKPLLSYCPGTVSRQLAIVQGISM